MNEFEDIDSILDAIDESRDEDMMEKDVLTEIDRQERDANAVS